MVKTRLQRDLPAYWKQAYFLGKEVNTTPKWEELRLQGKKKLSLSAQLKLEWIIFYHTQAKEDASKTAKHFGITRKTFHKWNTRFEKQHFLGLEEVSRAPHTKRKRTTTSQQKQRIVKLREKHIRCGKMKLQKRYERTYGEWISSWHIQKIIEDNQLYYDKKQVQQQKHRRSVRKKQKRKRITTLIKQPIPHYLWHVDTVVFTLPEGGYRYLLTAIDENSKLAYARLYATHSSRNASDFLLRLEYLTDHQLLNIHHDNGSEFAKEFTQSCIKLNLQQWYSRPHTPKDNPVLERFNRTIQEEFIEVTDVDLADIIYFNEVLLDWLIDYNEYRPHQTLDYLTPLQYLEKHCSNTSKVLPMSPSSTLFLRACTTFQLLYVFLCLNDRNTSRR